VEDPREVEVAATIPAALAASLVLEVAAAQVEFVAKGQGVGDGPALDLLRRPQVAGGFQHPGFAGVGDEEAVVVADALVAVAGRAALAVTLQQPGDHL
ncbi:hypothetical protein ACX15_00035, partial [Vibrio parahaemolyticus]